MRYLIFHILNNSIYFEGYNVICFNSKVEYTFEYMFWMVNNLFMKLGQLIDIVMENLLKVVSATFFLVCFLSLKESFCETRKKKIYFTSKALFVLEKMLKFTSLDIQILRRHQIPKHKTKNIFYWITWEVNTVCRWSFVKLCHITKEKALLKNSTKTATWKLVPGPFACVKN